MKRYLVPLVFSISSLTAQQISQQQTSAPTSLSTPPLPPQPVPLIPQPSPLPPQQVPLPSQGSAASNQYANYDKGYKITLPSGWQVKRDFMGLDVFATAPAKNEEMGSRANISVISTEVPDGISLDTYFSENVKNLEKSLKDFKQVETGAVAFDGFNGKKVAYLHTINDLKLKVVQYFILQNKHGYIITCAAENNEFPSYNPDFERSAKSFKVL